MAPSFFWLLLLGGTGCAPETATHEATVRRTGFGVPHVVAHDWGDLGFGQGYAFASDNGCVLLDQVIKVRGERARYLGRGPDDAHIDSDFAYRHLDLLAVAHSAVRRLPPASRELLAGYVAGFNAFVRERPGELPAACRGASWMRELTIEEEMAYLIDLGLLSSSRQLLPMIARATPPTERALRASPAAFPDLRRPGAGSNGWAVGGARSAHGGGLLVGNPHFPWRGELKLGEVHLAIPGELDVYGATLMGVPGVLVGFNERVAWTHTVSFAPRMTLYRLSLVPGDPTAYLYDGAPRAMEPTSYEIEVRTEDGGVATERRTLWRTHWGPVLDMPLYGWGEDVAFTYRDANLEAASFLEQFRRMSLARSVADIAQVHADVQGIPWVHTVAADADGDVLYADGSTVPALSDETLAGWLEDREADFFTRVLHERGAVLLPGDSSRAEWRREPRAARAGIVPWAEAPSVVRRDYVLNANDNHWLVNARAPLEGYSPLFGDERTPRSARTRMNHRLLLDGEAPLTADELRRRLFDNRGLHAELLLDELLARCRAVDAGERPAVTAACARLAAWDGRYDEKSVGAALFREWLGAVGHDALTDAGDAYRTPFDPDRPVATPRGLAEGDAPLAALAEACERLHDAGVSMDAALGEIQGARRGGAWVPVHGGQEIDGVANVAGDTSLPSAWIDRAPARSVDDETRLAEGRYPIDYGASFVFAVTLGDDGPSAHALLVYGQSGDPSSPHFGDQLPLYRQKRLRPVRYREEDVLADDELVERVVRGAALSPAAWPAAGSRAARSP